MEGMLIDVVIFLAAALIAVPLSIRLGFGSVPGYLLAGVAIGPWVLKLVTDVDAILHFAELGIVLMMFVIGLVMQVEKLWAIRRTIVGYCETRMVLSQRATTILLHGDMPLREPCESVHAFFLEPCGRFEMSRR